MTILNLDLKVFDDQTILDLKKDGIDIIFAKNIELVDKKRDVEMIVGAFSLSKLNLDLFENLKVIQLLSSGYDYLSKKILTNEKITILNAKDVYSVPISEWVVSQILSIYKKKIYFYENQKQRTWKFDLNLVELSGKNVCIFGTGSIGIEIAKRLKAFECNIVGVNSNGREVNFFDNCYSLSTVIDELGNFDILIFALPSNSDTVGYVNIDFLNRIKQNALFINVGRGDLINKDEFEEYLMSKNDVTFILDVFKEEPIESNNKLWDYQNVVLSPHNSFASMKNRQRLQELVLHNIHQYIRKGEFLNRVIFR